MISKLNLKRNKMNKQPSRFDVGVNDYIKFKNLKNEEREFKVYYGRVCEINSQNGTIGVKIPEHILDFPPGLPIYIEKKQIIQVYNSKMVEHLTPRLSIKHLWQDFIFREVKTTKCTNLLYAEYRYIGKNGFEKIKRFATLEEATSTIPMEFHKNIVTCYEDFFGFSKCKSLKNNDMYYDKEIFFSKKCYTELDWSDDSPTGDFLINERGYNLENPLQDAIICGIVENGEKGLFYRKWFLCSQEFMTLWTMVCDPSDSTLYENDISKVDRTDWARVAKHKVVEKKIKSFDKLLDSLDTSYYSADLNLELNERKIKYQTRNLERAALHYNTRYKQVAEVLFSRGFLQGNILVSSFEQDYQFRHNKFQRRLIRNLLWLKFFKGV